MVTQKENEFLGKLQALVAEYKALISYEIDANQIDITIDYMQLNEACLTMEGYDFTADSMAKARSK